MKEDIAVGSRRLESAVRTCPPPCWSTCWSAARGRFPRSLRDFLRAPWRSSKLFLNGFKWTYSYGNTMRNLKDRWKYASKTQSAAPGTLMPPCFSTAFGLGRPRPKMPSNSPWSFRAWSTSAHEAETHFAGQVGEHGIIWRPSLRL